MPKPKCKNIPVLHTAVNMLCCGLQFLVESVLWQEYVMPAGQQNDFPTTAAAYEYSFVAGGTRTSGRPKFSNIFGYFVISFLRSIRMTLVNAAVVTDCT